MVRRRNKGAFGVAKKRRRFPDVPEWKHQDRCVYILVLAGCGVCGRRLDDEDCPGWQALEHEQSRLGWRITCAICIAELIGKGKQ